MKCWLHKGGQYESNEDDKLRRALSAAVLKGDRIQRTDRLVKGDCCAVTTQRNAIIQGTSSAD
jgi:hypothetical protein